MTDNRWPLITGTKPNDPMKLKGRRRRVVRSLGAIVIGSTFLFGQYVMFQEGPYQQTARFRIWQKKIGESSDKFVLAVTTFLTSPTGSNQTFNVPSDWNSANNSIQTIGAGGGGGGNQNAGRGGGGGGGGAYSSITNLTLTPSGTATYQIGTGGTGGNGGGAATGVNGTAGGDTWFNGTTLGGSSVGSKGGNGGGRGSAADNGVGGAGGASASGVGTVKNSGGTGGTGQPPPCCGATNAGGGGGAAGAAGVGNNGTNAGVGGSGNSGTGGGGTGGAYAVDGGAGTNFDASHGSGGGGGGSHQGGLYGGGGGGGDDFVLTGASYPGRQGIIVVIYTPAVGSSVRNTGYIIG